MNMSRRAFLAQAAAGLSIPFLSSPQRENTIKKSAEQPEKQGFILKTALYIRAAFAVFFPWFVDFSFHAELERIQREYLEKGESNEEERIEKARELFRRRLNTNITRLGIKSAPAVMELLLKQYDLIILNAVGIFLSETCALQRMDRFFPDEQGKEDK